MGKFSRDKGRRAEQEVEWRTCVGFPDYEVSALGDVRRLTDSKRQFSAGYRMRGRINNHGYRTFKLRCADGRAKELGGHRLVLDAFVGPCPLNHECAHGNGKRDDNRLDNLRWATAAENKADQLRHGTMPAGERHGMAKLTLSQVEEIRSEYDAANGRRGIVAEIARRLGMSHSAILHIVQRRKWNGGQQIAL